MNIRHADQIQRAVPPSSPHRGVSIMHLLPVVKTTRTELSSISHALDLIAFHQVSA